MNEPSNGELLTHITYIRQSVDELKVSASQAAQFGADHEVRISLLEDREERETPKKTGRLGAIGSFLGGVISGFIGGKAAGG